VCKYLLSNGQANGEQMLKLNHTYMNERVIRWEQCVNICIDGALSMKEKERVMLLRLSKSLYQSTIVITASFFVTV